MINTKLRDRLPGGIYFNNFFCIFKYARLYGYAAAKMVFMTNLRIYFTGFRRFYDLQEIRVKVKGESRFYHITPAENFPDIIQHGLKHGERVFMTDSLFWFKRFMNSRKNASRLGKCCILEINVSRLCEMGHPVYITNRAHEFTTIYVPPECFYLMQTS